MLIFLLFLAVAYMPFLARASGGGLGVDKFPSWFNRVPEIVFGIVFGLCAYYTTGSTLIGVLSAIWSFIAMELGHGNAYHMGKLEKEYPDRFQTLDYVVRPVCKILGFAPRSAGYCWLFMGLKGFLIGLPALPFGIALAVLWPLAYYISFVTMSRDSEPAEWISGFFAGLVIAATATLY